MLLEPSVNVSAVLVYLLVLFEVFEGTTVTGVRKVSIGELCEYLQVG